MKISTGTPVQPSIHHQQITVYTVVPEELKPLASRHEVQSRFNTFQRYN
jgi:hypothetical protein